MTVISAFSTVSSFAQPAGNWQFEGGLGIYSAYDRGYVGTLDYRGDSYNIRHSEIVDISDDKTYNDISYENNPVVLPTLFLAGGFVFENAPVGLFLDVYSNYAWNRLNGGPSMLYERELIVHVMPELRLYYKKREDKSVYASLAIGMRLRHYAETYADDRITSGDVNFTYQISPVGVSYGRHWYFSWDIGYGRAYSAMKLNCGYRF